MSDAMAPCPGCGTAAEPAGNFCTGCGADLRGRRMPPVRREVGNHDAGATPVGDTDMGPAILACPGCGAVNAASRRRCGRCGVQLHDAASGRDAGAPTPTAPSSPDAGDEREGSRALVAATAVSALVVVVVLGMLLYQRWSVGDAAAAVGEPAEQEVIAARASSSLPAAGRTSYGAGNLFDDDPSTAWNEAAGGPGRGEWVELTLAEPADVTRLLIWNGHQKGALFHENARVRRLRIELGDESFTAELLDTRGPQAVDLPQPVRSDRLRLTIQDVYPGTRYDDGALSQVEVLAVS